MNHRLLGTSSKRILSYFVQAQAKISCPRIQEHEPLELKSPHSLQVQQLVYTRKSKTMEWNGDRNLPLMGNGKPLKSKNSFLCGWAYMEVLPLSSKFLQMASLHHSSPEEQSWIHYRNYLIPVHASCVPIQSTTQCNISPMGLPHHHSSLKI